MKLGLKKMLLAGIVSAAAVTGVSALAEDNISVMYNGDLVEFTEAAPQTLEYRTMLPFRETLETMGADVEYDEMSRTITAVKEDKTVTIVADDPVITVKTGEGTNTVEMDVAPYISDDKLYVPVRFVSYAFDMSVGWDEASQMVCIVDVDEYIKALNENCPNLVKMLEVSNSMADGYSGTDTINLFIGLKDFDGINIIDLADLNFIIQAEEVLNGSTVSGTLKMTNTVEYYQQDEEMQQFMESLNNLSADYIMDSSTLYFRLDGIDKIIGEDAGYTMDGQWFKYDLSQLSEMGMPFGDITAMISGSGMDYLEMYMKSMVIPGGETDMYTAIMIDAMYNTYVIMEDMIVYEENEDGTYSVAFEMDVEDIKALTKQIIEETYGETITDEELDEMDQFIEEFYITMDMSAYDSSMQMSIVMTGLPVIRMSVESQAEAGEFEGMEIPADAVDIVEFLNAPTSASETI